VIVRAFSRWWRGLGAASPYDATEVVSVDLETTSLDTRSAEILSIAAVPIRDRRIVLSERFEQVVRATAAVDREAVKYHRLRPVDVRHGAAPDAAARAFVEWLGGRPLLGYCIGFDCAMLERALGGAGRDGIDGPRFDLRDLYRRRALRRNPDDAPSQALDDILAALGVPKVARHTALGDATAVAMAFLGLKFGQPDTRAPLRRGATATRG
jgi:DNA polymerase-3 subunit epsilon